MSSRSHHQVSEPSTTLFRFIQGPNSSEDLYIHSKVINSKLTGSQKSTHFSGLSSGIFKAKNLKRVMWLELPSTSMWPKWPDVLLIQSTLLRTCRIHTEGAQLDNSVAKNPISQQRSAVPVETDGESSSQYGRAALSTTLPPPASGYSTPSPVLLTTNSLVPALVMLWPWWATSRRSAGGLLTQTNTGDKFSASLPLGASSLQGQGQNRAKKTWQSGCYSGITVMLNHILTASQVHDFNSHELCGAPLKDSSMLPYAG